jgi:RNA polymerase sigma-70 factor (ECF subfamily)
MMQLMPKPDAATGDDTLVRAATDGDRAAFGELYLRYARMIHGILLARVPPGEAEDLVQEVFLAAMKQLRGLRTAEAFRGWLIAIARHRATDYFRRARETASIELEPATSRGVEEDAFLVLERIRSLPEAYRETLILRLVEGMTGPEIAAHTGLRPDSVRVNLCRGMKMLRELLEGK